MAGGRARAHGHERLEARIGYRFADPGLLERALTHSSAVSPARRVEHSYQRLEFLGDRVLGLVIAEMLYRRLPNANEGEMSRALNALVRKETCAVIARQLELGAALNLGDSEARTGGAEKEAILGDVTEALIGAIYLDGGLGRAYEFIEQHFSEHIGRSEVTRSDAKTALQEWAQARGLEPPAYLETARTGPDHAPEFTISVTATGYAPVTASGPSKRFAEHRAAERFLLEHRIWKEPR